MSVDFRLFAAVVCGKLAEGSESACYWPRFEEGYWVPLVVERFCDLPSVDLTAAVRVQHWNVPGRIERNPAKSVARSLQSMLRFVTREAWKIEDQIDSFFSFWSRPPLILQNGISDRKRSRRRLRLSSVGLGRERYHCGCQELLHCALWHGRCFFAGASCCWGMR